MLLMGVGGGGGLLRVGVGSELEWVDEDER